MLDMSWGEVMLIGGVALIVIGPKDLPKALRTLGQITTKIRRMAGEFQHQFNEAIREAELDDIKRDIDGVKRTVDGFKPSFNPVDTIRNELKSAVEGRGTKASEPRMEPLADTSPAALARATAGLSDAGTAGGTYDVPRPLTPIAPDPEAPAAPEPPAAAPPDRTP